jgi:hypothetical protein
MRVVHIISLIARIALMITMVLGLLFWIAQVFAWSGLLLFLAQIGFPSIHEVFGTIGVLGLFILGGMAVFTKGCRWTGMGSILYAFLVPAFGMTQTMILVGNLHWLIQAAHLLVGIGAMYLVLMIEKRYQRLRLLDRHVTSASQHGIVGVPE